MAQVQEDEIAIRGLITEVETGWNVGDGAAFAMPFATDADYVIVNGRHVQGRQSIAVGHQEIFDTIYKGSRNHAHVLGVRFLCDDVAVAHVEWHLHVPAGTAVGEWKALNTMVLARNGEGWQIAAFQNTPIAYFGR